MPLRKRQYLIIAVIGVGLLLAIIRHGQFLGGAGVFLIVVGLVMDVLLLRCPSAVLGWENILGNTAQIAARRSTGRKKATDIGFLKS